MVVQLNSLSAGNLFFFRKMNTIFQKKNIVFICVQYCVLFFSMCVDLFYAPISTVRWLWLTWKAPPNIIYYHRYHYDVQYLFFYLWYYNIVKFPISISTDNDLYVGGIKHIMPNFYCDVSLDVISYERAILLATSHHWNPSTETCSASCYTSKRFDDIIMCGQVIFWHDYWIHMKFRGKKK